MCVGVGGVCVMVVMFYVCDDVCWGAGQLTRLNASLTSPTLLDQRYSGGGPAIACVGVCVCVCVMVVVCVCVVDVVVSECVVAVVVVCE